MSDNWKKFKQRFELYMVASGLKDKDPEIQCSTLLHIIGEDALDIYNTFEIAAQDRNKLDVLMKKFTAHFIPQKNVTYERHVFNTTSQKPGETIDQFVTELRNKAETCEFGVLCDSLIKDRIVVGVADEQLRARLLRDPELTLPKTLVMCHASEASKQQMGGLASATSTHQISAVRNSVRKATRMIEDCTYCGGSHPAGNCPAYGEKCKNCGGLNHYGRVCRSKKTRKGKSQNQRKLHHVQNELDSDSETDMELFVDAVNAKRNKEWSVELTIVDTETDVKFKLDTGAECNVISKRLIGDQRITKSKVKLTSYFGHSIRPIGKCVLLCGYKSKFYPLEFQVVDTEVTPVLGLDSCSELELIRRVAKIEEEPVGGKVEERYKEVFHGLGCLDGEHHIRVSPQAQPVIHAPRRVPEALRGKIKTELERMENLKVIEKVEEPSQWVSSMVTVVKPGKDKVRICLDPKDLNNAIEREHYPMKTIEEVVARMPNAKVFSTLDANSGYWQIPLDEESSKLCTFQTPFGRYRYKRLPFGIKSAPEVFQRTMSHMFDDIQGVEIVMDDILVWGESLAEHDFRL